LVSFSSHRFTKMVNVAELGIVGEAEVVLAVVIRRRSYPNKGQDGCVVVSKSEVFMLYVHRTSWLQVPDLFIETLPIVSARRVHPNGHHLPR
jgi:hypothetical protein